jgi:hypothetical protein
VTDWRRSFRAELFSAWRDAGLPDPGSHERDYDELRAEATPPAVPREQATGPLDPRTLHSVHGFGYVIGIVLADLLEVRSRQRAASVDWCARFNLGISLVDWLCDEAKLPLKDIAALPAFAQLNGRPPGGAALAHPAARFLDDLSASLLAELTRDAGPPRRGEPASALWPSLRRLMRAELAAAQPGFFDPAQPVAKLPLLRLKSVEPFRIMAERTVLTDAAEARVRIARHVGRAIGECVWLADDADDLWRDLDARSGNRFVAEAAAADARVLSADQATVVDLAVLRVLRRERIAERLCTRAVRRLASALRSAPCNEPERKRAAGLVGVALARWAS